MQDLKIKEEFKKLIPPLSKEEFAQLETNCLDEGIREAIVTWNGFIIDGTTGTRLPSVGALNLKRNLSTLKVNLMSRYG
jgi:hypothetical protein